MPQIGEGKDGSELDAIEAIVREGIRRGESGTRVLAWLGLGLLISLIATAAYFWPAKHIDPGVAVLLPVMTEGANVASNAQRQWEGFDRAFVEKGVALENRHVYHFDYKPKPSDQPAMVATLMDNIKALYSDHDVRTFIITMSGAALPLKDEFIEWRNTLPKRGRPVLVATVASATNIIDRENGVFRHYIRSRDEAAVIATYVEAHSATDVFLFYVNDLYGIGAKKVLETRLGGKLNEETTLVNPALTSDDQAIIDNRVIEIISEYSGGNAVVVIVGYGPMITRVIKSLRDTEILFGSRILRFDGTILVASTFTEAEWRPDHLRTSGPFTAEKLPFDQRVLAVGPTHVIDNEADRGVVYQFSFLTLVRALFCKDELGADRFWNCWTGKEAPSKGLYDEDWVDVEFTADGDSHVGLKVLRNDDW